MAIILEAEDIALYTFASFVLHWIVFYAVPIKRLGLDPSTSQLTHRSLLVSFFHAVVALLCLVAWLANFDLDLFNLERTLGGGLYQTGDEWMPVVVCFSLGYFIYDTTNMIVYPSLAAIASYLHHVIVGSAFLFGLISGVATPFHFLFLVEVCSFESPTALT